MSWIFRNGFYQEEHLLAFPFVRHGVSSRVFGNAKERDVCVSLCDALGSSESSLVRAEQVHGVNVVLADQRHQGKVMEATDGFITQVPGVAISVMTADCQSVFFVDPVSRSIGLAHAGWRGTQAGILARVVHDMEIHFGVNPQHLSVAIGPFIRSCCNEVGPEVADQFSGHWVKNPDGRIRLDLGAASVRQLMGLGIREEQIHVAEVCTVHEPTCFSYRRDQENYKRMMSLLEIHG